jgi:hypothetical protein
MTRSRHSPGSLWNPQFIAVFTRGYQPLGAHHIKVSLYDIVPPVSYLSIVWRRAQIMFQACAYQLQPFCLSVRPLHVTIREQMHSFLCNFIVAVLLKCQHFLILVKTGQPCRKLFINNTLRLCARKWPSGGTPGYLRYYCIPSDFLLFLTSRKPNGSDGTE